MHVGQVMLNPAIAGAAIGAGIGVVQKAGHDSSTPIGESALTGAEWGLGAGAAYVAIKTGMASKKVGYLTNPFRTSSMDTTGMTPDTIKALKSWGAI